MLRPIYAEYFAIDPLKLRPADRPPEIAEVDTCPLVEEIEGAFNITIPSDDAERLDGSFDSIVQYLAARRSELNESDATSSA